METSKQLRWSEDGWRDGSLFLILKMSKFRSGGPRVRVGNWAEDVTLEQDQLRDFLERRARGQLMVQRRTTLRNSILKSVDLAVPGHHVCFGDVVMLVNPGKTGPESRDPCALSIIADINNVRPHPPDNQSQSLLEPCLVGGARSLQPCVRNAFIISSLDGMLAGETLHYEQSFCLQTTEGFAGSLYLASDCGSFQKCAQKSRLQEVVLVEQLSFLCHWRVKHIDPDQRLEQEGYPVPVNSNVLISHCKTNQCLAVLENYSLWTPYGREYEITAHTLLDSHKAERDGNHWLIATSDPGNQRQQPGPARDEGGTETQPEHEASKDTHTHTHTHTVKKNHACSNKSVQK
ncbi:cilia- and flagella-associated protein 161 [Denticeps clupeoides]|uniref:Uncharacterized protein n=1 Tax=Denticeps clupeoides TaxID=299321 RepID=A0AAY4BNV2_9TELE|nr:cilia- and flagella-associated protein 161 [Denticeps clupeoides]